MSDLVPSSALQVLKTLKATVQKNDEDYRRAKGVYLKCPFCLCPNITLSAQYSGHGGLIAYCMCLSCQARGPEVLIMQDETDANYAAQAVREHWNKRNNEPYVDPSLKRAKYWRDQKLLEDDHGD